MEKIKLNEWLWWLPFGRVPEVSAPELQSLIKSGNAPQLLDVRTRAEWEKGHIAGAVHVPITGFRRRLSTINIDATRPIVTICLSAHRSIPAVRLLQQKGFQHVYQLSGGMLAWWRARLPTEV